MDTDLHHHRPVAARLAEARVLHRLSEAARERLVQAGSSLHLEAGQILFQAGDLAEAVFVVLEGEVELVARSRDGLDLRIAALGEGAILGEMAALEGGARSVDVVAMRRCLLYSLPRLPLMEALRTEPEAVIEMVIELSRRLRAANSTLEATMRLGMAGRLARLLLQSANSHALVTLTQTEMARRLAVSREQVNRTLKAWADGAIVQISPVGVRVVSSTGLHQAMRTSHHH